MANPGFFCDGEPVAPPRHQAITDTLFEVFDVHSGRNIAKLCYRGKQHFARGSLETRGMTRTSINEVLASNLDHFMKEREMTQAALARTSGVAQTTISLYLHPERRQPGKSGKTPSAKLSEVESLAEALSIEPWKLIRPMSTEERDAYEKIEAAFRAISPASGASPKKSRAA